MGKNLHRKPTIQIEMEASFDENQKASDGEMSDAIQANRGYSKAGKKMGAVGNETFTEKKQTRDDNFFMGKQSLSYQEYETAIWKNRPPVQGEVFIEWFAYVVLGIFTGLCGFMMDTIEESLVHFKDHFTQHQIDAQNLTQSWLFYALFSAFLGVLSCTLTAYWGPGANGSGVAEIIGYCSGVNYPQTISIPTFVTKIFGVVFAVAGGLTVGKEGPLAHIGANCGAITLYLFDWTAKKPLLAFLHNDHKKR